MNRGVMQSWSSPPPPLHQMMAGSPSWCNMRPPSQQGLVPPSSLLPHYYTPPPPSNLSSSLDDNQLQIPRSWSQLLLGGSVGDENHKSGLNDMQSKRMTILENWEEQLLLLQHAKQENLARVRYYDVFGHENGEFQSVKPNWPNQMMPVSSPPTISSITSLSSNNMLDFSGDKSDGRHPPPPDRSSECSSKATCTGGAAKKARVQPSSAQIPFKVMRKEKLGDRITALHQLVSPFGKTDTASVLLESIGYIRFLQGQIEALSLPYLVSKSGNVGQQQQPYVHGERNCLFPEDPGQLLNDSSIKIKETTLQQDSYDDELPKKDLKSRGLCLVPISCTQQIGSDNATDYYSAPAPAPLGGCFR